MSDPASAEADAPTEPAGRAPALAYLLLRDEAAVAAARTTVAGMPLWLRTVCGLADVGVERVVVVAPGGVAAGIGDPDPRLRVPVSVVAPDAIAAVAGPALLVRGDLAFHRELLRAVSRGTPDAQLVLAVVPPEDAPPGAPAERAGRVFAGACAVATAGDLIGAAARVGLDVAVVSAGGLPAQVEHPGGFAVLVGDPAAVRAAEHRLLEALRKPIDGIIARHVNRSISLQLTRRLMHTGLRPNHVSAFTLMCGLAAAVVCARGGYLFGVLGALLLETQSILDGVDGELARLKYWRSRLGEWMDTISDDLSNVLFMAAMAINLAREGRTFAIYVGAVGVTAFVLGQLTMYFFLVRVYRSGDLLAFRWDFDQVQGAERETRGARIMLVLRTVTKRDFFVTLFLVLALCARLDVALLLSAAGAVGFVIALVPQALRVWRAHAAQAPARR